MEDEFLPEPAPCCTTPLGEQRNDVSDQIDVSALSVLRRADCSAGVAAANSCHSFVQINVAPAKPEQFTLPHPRLQRDQAERPVRLILELGEERRQLSVLEVRGLLPLRPRPLRGRQLSNGIRVVRPVPAGGVPPPRTPRVTPPRPLTEAEASRIIRSARRTQWLVFATSIIFAVLTGLSALYVGKPWGTRWDYLWAFAWGLTTQTVIATIAAAVGGLGALGALRKGLGRPREPGPL